MQNPKPYLIFYPYLPLQSRIDFDDWSIGPVSEFDGEWADPDFERVGKAFLNKFSDADGKVIDRPSLIAHRATGVDGTLPNSVLFEALQLALDLTVVDSNPPYSDADAGLSWDVATSDSSEIFIWPIDVAGGYVAPERGSLVKTRSGGWRISDPELIIRSPLELHLPYPKTLDVKLLEACYRILAGKSKCQNGKRVRRLRTAVSWLSKAWRNTPSIRREDRVIFLKTGFEALTGTSQSRQAARWLRQTFDDLMSQQITDADVAHLLWSLNEQPRRRWEFEDRKTKATKTVYLTDLEHWFMSFSEARNTIIHDGRVPNLKYVETNSAYEGYLDWTGERLLREAIRVHLAKLGFKDLWRTETDRRWSEASAKFIAGVKELCKDNMSSILIKQNDD